MPPNPLAIAAFSPRWNSISFPEVRLQRLEANVASDYPGILGVIAIAAGFVCAGAGAAHAAGSSHLFSSEANARSICGKDTVVWADVKNPEYYYKGSPHYAQGKGAYTCERIAKSRGWHLAE
jgi:hypothetical protein